MDEKQKPILDYVTPPPPPRGNEQWRASRCGCISSALAVLSIAVICWAILRTPFLSQVKVTGTAPLGPIVAGMVMGSIGLCIDRNKDLAFFGLSANALFLLLIYLARTAT